MLWIGGKNKMISDNKQFQWMIVPTHTQAHTQDTRNTSSHYITITIILTTQWYSIHTQHNNITQYITATGYTYLPPSPSVTLHHLLFLPLLQMLEQSLPPSLAIRHHRYMYLSPWLNVTLHQLLLLLLLVLFSSLPNVLPLLCNVNTTGF